MAKHNIVEKLCKSNRHFKVALTTDNIINGFRASIGAWSHRGNFQMLTSIVQWHEPPYLLTAEHGTKEECASHHEATARIESLRTKNVCV
jgi:hypothetical protein